MSRLPERTEKNCLNCGATVQGRFCQHCGQENVETRETFIQLLHHFVSDIFHYDTRLWLTFKYIFLRPGFLSVEYRLGRRKRYFHPIQTYFFTSAFFFLIFFSFILPGENINKISRTPFSQEQRRMKIQNAEKLLKGDTTNLSFQKQLALLRDTTRSLSEFDLVEATNDMSFVKINGHTYRSKAAYDSLQKSLPAAQRDNLFVRKIIERSLGLNEKYRGNYEGLMESFTHDLFHGMPYLLFISLPFFALILKLVYVRRRREFFFADHAVFTLHLYIFSFLYLLIIFAISALVKNWISEDALTFLLIVLYLCLPVYLGIAMKKYYGQGLSKTIIKLVIVTVLSVFVMLLLFVIYLLITVFIF